MAKKSFFGENGENPALQFISSAEQPEEREQIPAAIEKAPEGYKVNPLYIETKSRRLQLVLQPSVYDRVKAKAKASGLSVNEFCHKLLDEATKEE